MCVWRGGCTSDVATIRTRRDCMKMRIFAHFDHTHHPHVVARTPKRTTTEPSPLCSYPSQAPPSSAKSPLRCSLGRRSISGCTRQARSPWPNVMSPIAALALQWRSLEKLFDPFRIDELIVSDGATQVRVCEPHAVVRLPVKIDLDAQHERA